MTTAPELVQKLHPLSGWSITHSWEQKENHKSIGWGELRYEHMSNGNHVRETRPRNLLNTSNQGKGDLMVMES